MLTIDLETARRFILGKQGVWPGRRWRGLQDTEQAMRAMEYLQLDRMTNTFVILGLWLEDETLGKDEAFAQALAGGLRRFVTFLGAGRLDAQAVREPLLRQRAGS